MKPPLTTNRRQFARDCFAGVLLPAAVAGLAAQQPPAPAKSKVVIARDPQLRGTGTTPDPARLLKLLDRAVQSFYGVDSPLEAWKRVARPGEVVGLKVNCLAGRGISTNVPLVEGVCERLQQAGIPARDIVVWDRLNQDLESAGFRPSFQSGRLRTVGNDVLGYEDELLVYGSAGSLPCKTLTQLCQVVINLPVLKDHGIVGVTMALKNAFGAIHNPNKYHSDAGNPYLADVNVLPPIRGKFRLTICDALTAQYEGGPSYMPHWQWPCNSLLVARDPVALDYTGWQIIERKRAEKGLKSLKEMKREPVYIATAADARHRLGTNDPRLIQVVEV
jgi:uncharacterized protein (DUF362 family)